MIQREAITVAAYLDLLDWLDKVRIGVWLTQHMIENHPIEITPHFHISSRIGQKDRIVAVYVFDSDNKGINLFGKDRALIGAVGEQFPEKGKQTEQGRQQRETAVAILNVGGGDDAVQQQALRIDQNMPLLALDQLAGIEAVAVDASPPFSALFTL